MSYQCAQCGFVGCREGDLEKTMEHCPAKNEELQERARALYLEPGVWPLLLLTDGQIGFYSHCGYSVGAIPLALELLRDLISG